MEDEMIYLLIIILNTEIKFGNYNNLYTKLNA